MIHYLFSLLIRKSFRQTKKSNWRSTKKTNWSFESFKPDVQQLTIKDVILEYQLNEEAKNKIERTKDIEKMADREDLVFER